MVEGGCQRCYIIRILGWQRERLTARPVAVLKEHASHCVTPVYKVGLATASCFHSNVIGVQRKWPTPFGESCT